MAAKFDQMVYTRSSPSFFLMKLLLGLRFKEWIEWKSQSFGVETKTHGIGVIVGLDPKLNCAKIELGKQT